MSVCVLEGVGWGRRLGEREEGLGYLKCHWWEVRGWEEWEGSSLGLKGMSLSGSDSRVDKTEVEQLTRGRELSSRFV